MGAQFGLVQKDIIQISEDRIAGGFLQTHITITTVCSIKMAEQ
jgi:hypothetical protein